MSQRDHLLYMLEIVQQLVKPLIDDITDEESMERGGLQINHVRWQTCHLLYTDSYLSTLLGNEETEMGKFQRLAEGGTEPSDEASAYPPMDELRTKLYALHDRILQAARTVPESRFAEEVGEENKKSPVWKNIAFLCMHDFYHAGQITHIRKMLGRGRPFV